MPPISSRKEARMQPRIHVITLGVDDLERALAFYREGLGLESPGIVGTEFPGDETTPAALPRCSSSTVTSFWRSIHVLSSRRTLASPSRQAQAASSASGTRLEPRGRRRTLWPRFCGRRAGD